MIDWTVRRLDYSIDSGLLQPHEHVLFNRIDTNGQIFLSTVCNIIEASSIGPPLTERVLLTHSYILSISLLCSAFFRQTSVYRSATHFNVFGVLFFGNFFSPVSLYAQM